MFVLQQGVYDLQDGQLGSRYGYGVVAVSAHKLASHQILRLESLRNNLAYLVEISVVGHLDVIILAINHFVILDARFILKCVFHGHTFDCVPLNLI